jgi:DNA (cytosine-5)-methyltransferase 1
MRTVDLFCGCGGMSLGFEQAGFQIVGAYDFWDVAVQTYNNNFNHTAAILDLSKKNTALSVIRPLNPEVIIGGPPCQDFSSAGDRTEGERANLTVSYAKIIKSIKPKYFVMENVSRAKMSKAYAEAREIFVSAGYGLTELVLDASKCGVPQKRKRFFCVGALNEPDDFLKKNLLANQSVISLSVRNYFTQNHYQLNIDYYYRHPRTYSRRAIYSVDEPSPTIRGVNRPRPAEYVRHKNDAAFNDDIASLTYRQRALIQTFPENFNFGNSIATAEQMIGNAVPVNLAKHIARALSTYENEKNVTVNNFSAWLYERHSFSQPAVKDTISRINRCNKILPVNLENINEYVLQLESTDIFKAFSSSVKSQLKRALTLYNEYVNNN